MTAEVAVLNKSAVAMAADSAMSVGDTGKIYPTNKLFALTKHQPIGIMVYNSAEFMGIPWETLVKMYRREIGSAGKPTVTDYAQDFLGYISNNTICTDDQRRYNLHSIAHDLFRRIDRASRQSLSETPGATNPDVVTVIRSVIERQSTMLIAAGDAPSMQNLDVDDLVCTYQADINELIQLYFDGYEVDDSIGQALHDLLARALKSASLSNGFSGLVFAGFGDDELFPSLVEVVTDGAIGSLIKADTRTDCDIARMGTQGAIVPFAQSEMVGRFMNGVDQEFLQYLEPYLENLLYKSAHEVLEASTPTGQLTESQTTGLREIVESNLEDFRNAAKEFCREHFVLPVLHNVKHLPKEELASMAEALVSLTSLKRRVSTDQETVGGPIDVAVISKGDGSIWIKRKHYFDPRLNRDYFTRQALPHNTESGGDHEIPAPSSSSR